MFGNGGSVDCGIFGIVGIEGRGGSVVVGLGRFGRFVGKGGILLGIEGKGGKLAGIAGMFGIEGWVVWRRRRVAKLKLIMFENVRATRKVMRMDFQEEAMAGDNNEANEE